MHLDCKSLTLKEVQKYLPNATSTKDVVYCIHPGCLFRLNTLECPAYKFNSNYLCILPPEHFLLCLKTFHKQTIKISEKTGYYFWSKFNNSFGLKILFNNEEYFIKYKDLECLSIEIIS